MLLGVLLRTCGFAGGKESIRSQYPNTTKYHRISPMTTTYPYQDYFLTCVHSPPFPCLTGARRARPGGGARADFSDVSK
jgi:hypothetical protein